MKAANIGLLKETAIRWPLGARAILGATDEEKGGDQNKEDRWLHEQPSIQSAE